MPKNTLPTTSSHIFRAKTPPSAPTSDPAKLGATPILKKDSTSQIYSSTHRARDERITAMSREIYGRIVGPVKVDHFLNQYLPKAPNPCPKITAETQAKHKSFSESSSEFAMYKPWINFMSPFCPNLDLVDAHDTPAVDFGGKQVKPDIQIFSANSKRSGLSDMTQTEMTVEFKKAVWDDAFSDQWFLGAYSQAAQFRTHVFLVLVFPNYARFMRWDRSGAIVTEKVRLSNPSYVEFFWRFNHASPAARGVDSPSPFRRLQHYRLVLNEIGRSLSDFRDTKEMVTAVRDAIVAHGDAYDKAEILTEISALAIFSSLPHGGGLLIYWDLCKMLKHIHQGQAHTERD
ncbi:hypothetical protein BU17DRAFT_72035, partial [Hysterangium stoloniferum]